jgi:transcriptional regulator with XRE-family HTH domain
MTTEKTTAEKKPMTPAEIGHLVKAFREDMGWSQETLAELTGLTVRTVQRVEAGEPSSPDTRRALARAFKIQDLDFFLKPNPVPTPEEIAEQKAKFERDNVVLDAKVVSGRDIVAMFSGGHSYHAMGAANLVELPKAAQDAFATISDFSRDCMDIAGDVPSREMLAYGDQLDEFMEELRDTGYCVAAAVRHTSLVNDSWENKKPLPWTIIYLLAAPIDRPPSKVVMPRNVGAGGF